MNATALSFALRQFAETLREIEPQRESDADSVELIRVLARIIEGKPVARAFGAPGDWGYGTPIGDALAAS